jgi:hypothetical protein
MKAKGLTHCEYLAFPVEMGQQSYCKEMQWQFLILLGISTRLQQVD